MADAVCDRLVHNAYVIFDVGPDRLRRHATSILHALVGAASAEPGGSREQKESGSDGGGPAGSGDAFAGGGEALDGDRDRRRPPSPAGPSPRCKGGSPSGRRNSGRSGRRGGGRVATPCRHRPAACKPQTPARPRRRSAGRSVDHRRLVFEDHGQAPHALGGAFVKNASSDALVAAGLPRPHHQRDHRCPGTRAVISGRFFALTAAEAETRGLAATGPMLGRAGLVLPGEAGVQRGSR